MVKAGVRRMFGGLVLKQGQELKWRGDQDGGFMRGMEVSGRLEYMLEQPNQPGSQYLCFKRLLLVLVNL